MTQRSQRLAQGNQRRTGEIKQVGGTEPMMRTARVLMVMVALAAVIGWSSAATATTFDVTVNVGFVDASGTCQVVPGGTLHTNCLGFAGTGGFTDTSTRLNWDNSTTGSIDSFLSVGALPKNPATNFP